MVKYDIKHEAQIRYTDPAFRNIERDCFTEGAGWAQEKMIGEALDFIDEFFAGGGTVDDLVRDNPNLYQGRVEFIKRMHSCPTTNPMASA